jgi:sugar phosphate isomerase/epimerase
MVSGGPKREIYFSFFMFTADLRPDDKAYTQTIVDHLTALTAMGYDGFDLHIAPQPSTADHPLDHRYEVDGYARLKDAFVAAGLADVRFTTNVGTTRTFDPTSPYGQQREQALSYLRSRVDITRVLGGDGSIMSGPFLYPYGAFPQTDAGEPIWSDALRDWIAPRFAAARSTYLELAGYAAAQGVQLALEPVKSWESPPPNQVSEALDFLDTLDGPAGGVTIDTAQVVMESQGPGVFADNVARAARDGRLLYVHVSAPDRGAVHDSWIPWSLMLGELEPVYRGPYLVEVFNAIPPFDSSMRMARRRFWRPGEDEPEARPSAYDVAQAGLDTLREQLAAAGGR